ncbi:MAG TPA: Ku protein [Thermoanaerobaculia bacterium]
MPRSIWKGSITFGLVNIPVGLYAAESRHELELHLLDKRDKSPVRYKRVSETSGKEVPWADVVRGYEYEDGRYVVLSDEDLKRANPVATQTIDITDFVDAAEISPVYFDKPYYLAPERKGTKSYALLREALGRSGKVGIATVVIRTRQYLAAVVPQDDVLVLELLRYAHELRDAEDLEIPHGRAGVNERELALAERLIEGMVGEWEPEKYTDTYEKDVMKMIERRVAKGETAAIEKAAPKPPAEGGKVVDLMMLLKRSVEGNGKGAAKPRAKSAARPKRSHAAPHRKSA